MNQFWKVHPQGLSIIQEYIISILEKEVGSLPHDKRNKIMEAIENYINNHQYEEAKEIFQNVVGSTCGLEQVREIIEVSEEPLPALKPPQSSISLKGEGEEEKNFFQRKSRNWSEVEDKRLLSGILQYGTDNWEIISIFVGNSRSRAQCSQRWFRILNPELSKNSWSSEEEDQLIHYVEEYGDKSWTKISRLMKTRSDVQCRYHYLQLIRNNSIINTNKNKNKECFPNQFITPTQFPLLIYNSPMNFPNLQPQRFSQPNINNINLNSLPSIKEKRRQSYAPHVLLPSISELLKEANIKEISFDEFLQKFQVT